MGINTNVTPASIARLLQEYKFENVGIDSYASILIERTLELGNWDELRWLFNTYGIKRIGEYTKKLGHRRSTPVTFNYWRKLLGIEEYCRAPFEEIRKTFGDNYHDGSLENSNLKHANTAKTSSTPSCYF